MDKEQLIKEQEWLNDAYQLDGLTDEVLTKQVELNKLRNELDIPDEDEIDGGFVQ